ncbi:MAG: hypothetical protein PVJ32_07445 [Anaerolineales bacterium]
MPRIRCHYIDCVYLEDGHCEAPRVQIDPDEGCMTYSRFDDVPAADEWDDESLDDFLEDEDEELHGDDEMRGEWLEEDVR